MAKVRKFSDVVMAIQEVAPQDLKEALSRSVGFWAPEIAWHKLTEYVNRYVTPSSKDATAIAVYARLCDCSEDEMKARFEADGR
jgi:hypothetical protein